MCLSAFWVFFILLTFLFWISLESVEIKKNPSEYQETEILLASKIGETTSKKSLKWGLPTKLDHNFFFNIDSVLLGKTARKTSILKNHSSHDNCKTW